MPKTKELAKVFMEHDYFYFMFLRNNMAWLNGPGVDPTSNTNHYEGSLLGWGVKAAGARADTFATFMCRLSENPGNFNTFYACTRIVLKYSVQYSVKYSVQTCEIPRNMNSISTQGNVFQYSDTSKKFRVFKSHTNILLSNLHVRNVTYFQPFNFYLQ